jgi:hypothetical protein
MCSNVSDSAPREEDHALAARLGNAIDDLAAIAGSGAHEHSRDLASRLAATWAIITAADPELADRTARYSR